MRTYRRVSEISNHQTGPLRPIGSARGSSNDALAGLVPTHDEDHGRYRSPWMVRVEVGLHPNASFGCYGRCETISFEMRRMRIESGVSCVLSSFVARVQRKRLKYKKKLIVERLYYSYYHIYITPSIILILSPGISNRDILCRSFMADVIPTVYEQIEDEPLPKMILFDSNKRAQTDSECSRSLNIVAPAKTVHYKTPLPSQSFTSAVAHSDVM